ncbi:hypothetical protein COB21_01290 [Candidatus Aerophobetes bacterium]|uniref:Uncharacterized protein n=1 Tax=Aerophobetes bacterium TaxID=2030807 RepID=A0A2A4X6N7_UNCAE|nr:MAG: hypothetical protein COB21_01290 [Candidatus Aerophobetes bacterium]
MTEITTDSYDTSSLVEPLLMDPPVSNEDNSPSAEEVIDSRKASPKDSHDRILSEQNLKVATNASLDTFYRIESLKKSLAFLTTPTSTLPSIPELSKIIDSYFELFALEIQQYQNNDHSLELFTKKADAFLKTAKAHKNLFMDRLNNPALKNLISTYFFMLVTIDNYKNRVLNELDSFTIYTYQPYYLQTAKLGDSLNCPIRKQHLLYCERSSINNLLYEGMGKGWVCKINTTVFYWLGFMSTYSKLLVEEEKEDLSLVRANSLVQDIVSKFFSSFYVNSFPPASYFNNDPVKLFSPFIAKHGTYKDFAAIRLRFNETMKDLHAVDQTFEWIKLHLEMAISPKLSTEKQRVFLNKAKEITSQYLWSLPISRGRDLIEQRREEALELITKVEAQFSKTSKTD